MKSLLILLSLFCFVPGNLSAQETDRNSKQTTPATFPAFGLLRTQDDKPIRGAIVTYTNTATGETRTSVSNPLGYVRFNVVFGQDYSVTIKHKKYSFGNRTVTYQNSNFGVIIRAQQ